MGNLEQADEEEQREQQGIEHICSEYSQPKGSSAPDAVPQKEILPTGAESGTASTVISRKRKREREEEKKEEEEEEAVLTSGECTHPSATADQNNQKDRDDDSELRPKKHIVILIEINLSE
ncbi:hypothetical protein CYMTET_15247 [Cymbomonas tetramitiformis]|uniref:Uncharacterized protein n=1 Tax=Cymbomonas tetramitiformis TaxID=36881 RepID=A0AAE0GEF3_9CHLO|nr:hypothetical protein CYMTET_15247 [Cymbomonas tetramitiformis]